MLSRRARSAVAAMVEVARLARGRPLPARAIAATDGLAPRQFESVLQDLVHAGLLRSSRGPQGGYELARERRRISLGAIVRAIDEPTGAAPATAPGPVAFAIAQASLAFMACLDRVTIEDLCRQLEPEAGNPSGDPDFHI